MDPPAITGSPPHGVSPLHRLFPFGIDVNTRELVVLSLAHFLTSYWCMGEIGIGKSNHLLAPLYAALLSVCSGVIIDGSGTIATNVSNAVAWLASMRLLHAQAFPEFRRQAAAFVRRHPLIVFGGPHRSISINFLARQRISSGGRETLEQVALRTYQVFNRLFADDADKRVRFRRVGMAVIAILAAAGRPIRDYKTLLRLPDPGKNGSDPAGAFLARCLREAETIGVPPGDRRFYEDSVRSFQDLRRLSASQFRAETESTDNAFNLSLIHI